MCVKLHIYKNYTDMHGQQNRKFYRKYFALSCALKYLFDCPSMHCRGLQLEMIYSHAPILELVSPARFRRAVIW